MLVRVTESHTPLWNEATAVVKQKFSKSYQANIDPSPQYFVVTQSADENILACAGITFGDDRKLFSEQYLLQPFERILSDRIGTEIERSAIAEVGNLISHHSTAGVILVNMLPLLAWCMGAQYLLCTITPRVREMLESCQIVFEPMQVSDPGRLQDAAGNWGSYYEQMPVTGFVKVDPKGSRFAAMTVATVFSQAPILPKRAS